MLRPGCVWKRRPRMRLTGWRSATRFCKRSKPRCRGFRRIAALLSDSIWREWAARKSPLSSVGLSRKLATSSIADSGSCASICAMKESNMRLNETELKEIYQRGTARSPSQADCLTADEIARISNGEIDEQERFRMANHLMLCSDCAEEYRLINPLKSIAALAAPERAAGQSQSNSVGSAHQSNYESVSGAPRRLV